MKKIKILFFYLLITLPCFAAKTIAIPKFDFGMSSSSNPDDLVTSLQILLILTILTLAPAILMMTTSFVRIVIVLHFIRQAIGLQQMPPNQVLVGLALFLTFFIMQPTFEEVLNKGVNPYLEKKINQEELFKVSEKPIKTFMLRQTKTKDLELFLKASKTSPPKTREEISLWVVMPAFMISEITKGFQIGILIFIPFIIIDMIVATVLMSLGMMMLPPVMISMPFKLLLFVMIDGWSLIIESLILSYG